MPRRTAVALALLVIAILAVVAVSVISCGSSTTTTTGASSTTAGPSTTGAIDAAALFAANCQGCHSNLPSGSAGVVKTTIQNGKGSMPSFTGKLTADQITALANYVASGGK